MKLFVKIFKVVLIFALIASVVFGALLFRAQSSDKSAIVVKSKIEGKIIEVNCENNSDVKAGQIVALIDTSAFQNKLAALENDLKGAKNNLKISNDDIYKIRSANKRANDEIESAKLKLNIANSDYVLYQNAYRDGAVTLRDLSGAKKNLETAHKNYEKALSLSTKINSDLQKTLSDKALNNAEIEKLTQDIKAVRLLIAQGTIIAPADGKIKSLKISAGKEVEANEALFLLIPSKKSL